MICDCVDLFGGPDGRGSPTWCWILTYHTFITHSGSARRQDTPPKISSRIFVYSLIIFYFDLWLVAARRPRFRNCTRVNREYVVGCFSHHLNEIGMVSNEKRRKQALTNRSLFCIIRYITPSPTFKHVQQNECARSFNQYWR